MSDNLSDNGHSPEEALLGGDRSKKHAGRCKWQGWLNIGLGVWAAVATVGMFFQNRIPEQRDESGRLDGN